MEAVLLHADDVRLPVATEPILLDLEEALTVRFRLLVAIEVDVSVDVDGVLDPVFAGELATLVDLTDEGHDAEPTVDLLLRPVRQLFRASKRGSRVDRAVLILPVVQRLERVLEDEHLALGVLGTDLVGVLEEVLELVVLTDDETVLELEALRDHLDLVVALLARVQERNVTGGSEGVRDLEHQGRLTSTRLASDHHRRGRRETLTTESIVDPVDSGRVLDSKLGRDVDVEDVGTALEVLVTDVQVHVVTLQALGEGLVQPACSTTLSGSSGTFTVLRCFFGTRKAPGKR